MNKPLKNEKNTNILPLDIVHTPKLDESIACIVPKSTKTYDRYLIKLQQFVLDDMGPLLWVRNYSERNEQREMS